MFQIITTLGLAIICCAMEGHAETSAQAPDYGATRERLAREVLERDPKSESARLKLSGIYIDQKRYSEARAIIDSVLQDNPSSIPAKMQSEEITILTSDLSLEEKTKRILKSSSQWMAEIVEPLRQVAGDLNSLKDESALRRKALDVQYEISSYQFPPEPRRPILERAKLLSELHLNGKLEEAISLAEQDLVEYPNSVEARLRKIDLLVSAKRFEEAHTLTTKSLAEFPNHPMLRINQDGITQIQAAKTAELQQMEIVNLSLRLMNASMVKFDTMMRPKRAPTVGESTKPADGQP